MLKNKTVFPRFDAYDLLLNENRNNLNQGKWGHCTWKVKVMHEKEGKNIF